VKYLTIFALPFQAVCTRKRVEGRAQNNAKLITKKVYLVRHGQTDFNLKNIVQGSGVDTDLNDFGRRQAESFFKAYHHVSFDRVYTSVLKRTKQTVQPFVSQKIPTESIAGLNEISWGTKEGHRVTPEEDEYYHYMLRQWQIGNTTLRIEGGESKKNEASRRSDPQS
jgi:probable phosphoglycerate mutase